MPRGPLQVQRSEMCGPATIRFYRCTSRAAGRRGGCPSGSTSACPSPSAARDPGTISVHNIVQPTSSCTRINPNWRNRRKVRVIEEFESLSSFGFHLSENLISWKGKKSEIFVWLFAIKQFNQAKTSKYRKFRVYIIYVPLHWFNLRAVSAGRISDKSKSNAPSKNVRVIEEFEKKANKAKRTCFSSQLYIVRGAKFIYLQFSHLKKNIGNFAFASRSIDQSIYHRLNIENFPLKTLHSSTFRSIWLYEDNAAE